ncbi:hypothetical protein [Streptomyces sp. NBC_01431]|nr:hypothetical protein [Streptomyces sp. NBC_01431]
MTDHRKVMRALAARVRQTYAGDTPRTELAVLNRAALDRKAAENCLARAT